MLGSSGCARNSDNLVMKTAADNSELIDSITLQLCRMQPPVCNQISKYQIMLGTIQRAIGKKTRQDLQPKFYKIMIVPVFLCQ